MGKSNLGPKFKQIKEDIVEDILSSVYLPGDVLPTQEEYASKYNVSRLTVRKAMDDLVLKGILRTEKGRGTFVQEVISNTYSYRRLSGFTSNIGSKKIKVTSRVISIQDVLADKRLSMKLEIPIGDEVVLIERLRYANGICASFQRAFLIKARVKNIDFLHEDLEQGSLYELLRSIEGITIGFADEHFRAVRATKEIAEFFAVEEGDPVLYVNRVAYDSSGRPVEYCENSDSSDVNGIWVKSVSL